MGRGGKNPFLLLISRQTIVLICACSQGVWTVALVTADLWARPGSVDWAGLVGSPPDAGNRRRVHLHSRATPTVPRLIRFLVTGRRDPRDLGSTCRYGTQLPILAWRPFHRAVKVKARAEGAWKPRRCRRGDRRCPNGYEPSLPGRGKGSMACLVS
jgi:hypothetical protein